MEYLVLDFETTGAFRGNRNLPWQIGAVRMADRKVVPEHSFSLLLNIPHHHEFNPYSPGRWASIRTQLDEAPTLLQLWPQLKPWLDNRALVAHNVPTERTLLAKAFPMHTFQPWIDTLVITRKAYPKLISYKLEDIVPTLGLTEKIQAACPDREPHDALYDAFAAAFLLEHILNLPGWDKLSDQDLILNT